MEKTVTLEEALKRIEELEKENAELREELEYYRNRKLSGRQNVSERTIYRYKAYYDKMKKKEEQTILLTSVKWFNVGGESLVWKRK